MTALAPWRNTAKPAFTMEWAFEGVGAKENFDSGAHTFRLDGGKLISLVSGVIEQTPFDIPLTVKGAR